MRMQQEHIGDIAGQAVYAFTLKNDQGMEVVCLNYGCAITKIVVPDRDGNYENVVLGFRSLEEYMENSPYFGVIVGRTAGRIRGASFELDGATYHVTENHNGHHIHGGKKGFSHAVWNARIMDGEEAAVQFTYMSPDGEEGYPGNVHTTVRYTLSNDNELCVSYEGTTDHTTLLNVTNHTYFNLSGDLKRDVLDHVLMIQSDEICELNEHSIPTGRLLPVAGTPFDFREGKAIGADINASHPQLVLAGGYDHPFLLKQHHAREITVKDIVSGRCLLIETDEPSVVLYTGNYLPEEGSILGVPSKKRLGFCLETQGLPDAIHHPHFPSCVLASGERYSTVTKYAFSVDQ